MSQLFAAVYEVESPAAGQPEVRLNLVINISNCSVMGYAQMMLADGHMTGISVRGQYVEMEGDDDLKALVLAGVPSIFPSNEGEPSAFQLLMVLPSAWKAGQVCYKISYGPEQAHVIEARAAVATAIAPSRAQNLSFMPMSDSVLS